jgi:hypothetical protein
MTDDELISAALRVMQHELDAQASSIAGISCVLRRLPYGASEVRFLRHAIELSRGKGLNITAGPIELSLISGPEWMHEGFFFVTSLDLQVELLILKGDAKGLFGGQNVRYVCFYCSRDRRYHPVGETKSSALAFAKLTALHKLQR